MKGIKAMQRKRSRHAIHLAHWITQERGKKIKEIIPPPFVVLIKDKWLQNNKRGQGINLKVKYKQDRQNSPNCNSSENTQCMITKKVELLVKFIEQKITKDPIANI